jgi:short-subunit dehydrogenase
MSQLSSSAGWILATLILLYVFRLFQKKSQKKPVIGDQKVCILGASSGIGKELAILYASKGHDLLLVARRQSLLQQVQAECLALISKKGLHNKVLILAMDATREENVQKISQVAQSELEGCDTLICCMGVISLLTFEELCSDSSKDTSTAQPSRLHQVMNDIFSVNVFGPILACKHFFPLLRDSREGRVIAVSSIAGVFGAPTRTLYCATKAALNGFMESLRIEWKRHNISIINILPGSVDTEIRKAALDASLMAKGEIKAPSTSNLNPKDCAKKIMEASNSKERSTFMPSYYGPAQLIKYFYPDWVDSLAAKKYGFSNI